METRVAVISIIVEQEDAIEELNILLHEARQYIVGRMGIPYRAKGISIISIVIDAPQDTISALSGKIGRLKGVSAKTAFQLIINVIQIASHKMVQTHRKQQNCFWMIPAFVQHIRHTLNRNVL